MMPPEQALAAGRATAPARVKLPPARTLILAAADVLGLLAALLASRADDVLAWAGYATAVIFMLFITGQQRVRICLRVSDQASRIVAATVLPVVVLVAWIPPRQAVVLVLWSAALVYAGRLAGCGLLRTAHRRDRLTEPVLVVGAGTFGAYVADLLLAHPELGLRPRGFLDDGPPRRDLPLPTIGRPADLADVVDRLGIRRIIVCFSTECRDEDLVAVLRASAPSRADVCVVPRLYELGMAVPRGCLDELWGIPLIPLRRSGLAPAGRMVKRAFDGAVAALLLAVCSPLLLALTVVIRLRSGQSPLFRQARVTGRGRVAQIVKLRTLASHADQDTRWTGAAEDWLGRALRASHLDELPQLLSVIRGEMSLVGPRPERPYFAEQFSQEISRYGDRTRMPAGMTGWAQVNGLNGDTSIFERARFDNYYVEYWSVWLDVVILAQTAALIGRGLLRLPATVGAGRVGNWP